METQLRNGGYLLDNVHTAKLAHFFQREREKRAIFLVRRLSISNRLQRCLMNKIRHIVKGQQIMSHLGALRKDISLFIDYFHFERDTGKNNPMEKQLLYMRCTFPKGAINMLVIFLVKNTMRIINYLFNNISCRKFVS